MKIGLIGDMHFKEKLGYSEYVSDRRVSEKAGVLDFIEATFKDHDAVVFMGDNLNSRNNHSDVIRDFVCFVERFDPEKTFILAGNHEKWGDGRSAIDFLKQVRRPWKVITDKPEVHKIKGLNCVFLPFMARVEVGAKTDEEASRKIEAMLPAGDVLFGHQTISDINMNDSIDTGMFNEPVLNKDFLKTRYRQIAIGHIHNSYQETQILLTGSTFTNEVNELDKYIWTIEFNEQGESVTGHRLPERAIKKLINPTPKDIAALPHPVILKVEMTKRDIDVGALKKQIQEKGVDGLIFVEKYFNERRQIEAQGDILEYSIERMLEMYAKNKNLDPRLLLEGYDLIRT